MLNQRIPALVFLLTCSLSLFLADASQAQIIINLPTVNQFNVRTTVMVPDGGQMLLGGVNRGSFGAIQRGTPGFSNLPVANRLFKNRGIGQTNSSALSSVTTRVIIAREIEEQVMAEARRRQQLRILNDVNRDPKTLKKAEFLSRNIGRKRDR